MCVHDDDPERWVQQEKKVLLHLSIYRVKRLPLSYPDYF